jgi:enoyl-CoA hydratase
VANPEQVDRYAGYSKLKFDRPHAKVLRVTMDNGKFNTADHAMHAELARIWLDIDTDPDINAAIITGAGSVFSAGGDFAMIKEIMGDFAYRARAWREARDIVYNIVNCSKPIVSAMRGLAIGAGLVCGLLADISIASKDCRIVDGHTRLGVAAGDHAAIIWPLLCGMAKAKYYLLLCGRACRRRSGADRTRQPRRRRRRARPKGGRHRGAARRRRTERHTLDEIRAQQLAAPGGTRV